MIGKTPVFVTAWAALIVSSSLFCCDLLAGQRRGSAHGPGKKDYSEYVDPFVGTGAHGHTFPGAVHPFGMIQLSPDTRGTDWDGCSGYHHSDSTINGFSHTHLSGTGIPDYCDILVMPAVNYNHIADITPESYSSPFSHSSEKASPGYYSVHLDRWNVDAELTVSQRVGMHRYSFPKNSMPQIIIDLEPRDFVIESSIELEGVNAIGGYRRSRSWAEDQRLYFYMEFSRSFLMTDIHNREGEDGSKAVLSFRRQGFLSTDNVIMVKVAVSSVSVENARENLRQTSRGWNFDAMRLRTRKAWNSYLSKIEVEGDPHLMRCFYTALYHTAISPNLFSDVNGEYRGMDGKVHKAGFNRYTVFSLWDTFRSLNPLLGIIERGRTKDFLDTFQSIFDEGGKLPVWELWGNETNCMIGYNSAPVVADAVSKGIFPSDADRMLSALVASSNRNEFGIKEYAANGIVSSSDEQQSVSKTLEYAYDDWCIAQTARLLRPFSRDGERCDSIYRRYMERALSWRNTFDPVCCFARPIINGGWLKPFDPSEVNGHYTEANAWQYSMHVQQDISGLIARFGSEKKFEERLDELFETSSETTGWRQDDMTGMIGQYVHGNEPSHHIAYLYSYIGKPWKAQERVRRICTELYDDTPEGLCGNDDCGQMSAWYVFSALGFYPVTPGSGTFVLGSPLFKKATIHLENGRDFTVNAPSCDAEHLYVSRVMRNGQPFTKSFFNWDDIDQGAVFDLDMTAVPDTTFGLSGSDRPNSGIDIPYVESPVFDFSNGTFRAFSEVSISSLSDGCDIWYSVDYDDRFSASEFVRYTGPFTIARSAVIKAWCEDGEGDRSHIASTSLQKVSSAYGIDVFSRCSEMYNAGGDDALLDGIRGGANFHSGRWQGYQGCDFEAVIDLKKTRHITSITAGFLQSARSWILMPKYVEYYTSADGETFHFAGRIGHEVRDDDYTPQVHDLTLVIDGEDGTPGAGTDARKVKVRAVGYGKLPSFHPGAGCDSYIFVDEIMIK